LVVPSPGIDTEADALQWSVVSPVGELSLNAADSVNTAGTSRSREGLVQLYKC
jgi:hypothetical protein